MHAVEAISRTQQVGAESRVWGGGPAPRRALIVPSRPEDLLTHYDVTISLPSPGQPQFQAFTRWLAEEVARPLPEVMQETLGELAALYAGAPASSG